VSTWILGIAYRKALKRIERQSRAPEDLSAGEAGLEELGGPDRSLERRVLQDALQGALDKLSPAQRAVVELTYYHGYSCGEVAEIVQCPVGTVKTRMFHARKRLRELLPRPGGGRAAKQVDEGVQ
jgi:RNA polymerase sigma-70 factor (ECF subfamily)